MADYPRVRLGEVLTARQETPDEREIESGAVRIIGKIGFAEGQIELRNNTATKTGMILIQPGDLVLSGINAAKGAISIYGGDAPVAATIHYSAYSHNKDHIDLRFLWWFLRSQFFRDLLIEHVPGGIKTELKPSRFLQIPIPLPPLTEQQRIVARIETIAQRVEEARGLRQKSVEEAEALIGSYLGALVSELDLKHQVQPLGNLLIEAGYGTSVKCQVARGFGAIPVLRIPNVALEKVTMSDLKFGQISDSELRKVTLSLYSRVGEI